MSVYLRGMSNLEMPRLSQPTIFNRFRFPCSNCGLFQTLQALTMSYQSSDERTVHRELYMRLYFVQLPSFFFQIFIKGEGPFISVPLKFVDLYKVELLLCQKPTS